jgi:HSP20 family protein
MTGRARHLGDLQGEIQDLFADLWEVSRFSGLRRGFRPQCDCFRTEDPPALHLVFELPGIDPGDIHLDTTEHGLVVSGRRERPHAEGARWHQVEIEYGAFERRLELAEAVDAGAASTSYDAGMLRIELPLRER